jgi:DNA-binding MarR family transcriptional regulator
MAKSLDELMNPEGGLAGLLDALADSLVCDNPQARALAAESRSLARLTRKLEAEGTLVEGEGPGLPSRRERERQERIVADLTDEQRAKIAARRAARRSERG